MKEKRTRNIGEVAKAAGISERALRHYEAMGLISPKRDNNGYRAYDSTDERRLVQIIAMRSCGLPLSTIRDLVQNDGDLYEVLTCHLKTLRRQLDETKQAEAKTLSALQMLGRIKDMDTDEAFEEMKKQGLIEFEKTYGEEARALYGDEAIDEANKRMMSLSKDEWDAKELLEEAIKVQLRLAMATGDTASAESEELARMHERWIGMHWGHGYAKGAYLGLVQGYAADPRFVKYYDSSAGDGATDFLIKAVMEYQTE